MLDDVLSYVIHSEVFFNSGPYLMCSNCIDEACVAYTFKRRCEEASMMLKDYGLVSCTKEDFSNSRNSINKCSDLTDSSFDVDLVKGEQNCDEITLEEVDLSKPIKEENLLQENLPLDVDGNEFTVSRHKMILNIKDTSKEGYLTGSDDFLCFICGLKKPHNSFCQHMLRHTGEKLYVCPYCQKRFNEKGNMKVHIRIHTGVQPYTCDICGKRFVQSTSLKIHKRVHDDVKPFKCNICPHRTRTSSQLQMHVKRHVGIKNYHCALCEYSACSKSELKKRGKTF